MTDKFVLSEVLKPLQTGLKRALESYQALLSQDIPSDPKGFTTYHNACKAALMHVAWAVKMMDYTSPPESSDETNWIDLAKEALKSETEDNHEIIFS
ncbi:MAG: hypothetical protein SPL08_05530 [Pseudomonadota bacterium]|nr:hypothetical protein [Pseudomonadota bacterium]